MIDKAFNGLINLTWTVEVRGGNTLSFAILLPFKKNNWFFKIISGWANSSSGWAPPNLVETAQYKSFIFLRCVENFSGAEIPLVQNPNFATGKYVTLKLLKLKTSYVVNIIHNFLSFIYSEIIITND